MEFVTGTTSVKGVMKDFYKIIDRLKAHKKSQIVECKRYDSDIDSLTRKKAVAQEEISSADRIVVKLMELLEGR